MYEYQITVHPNGMFMFRTEWRTGAEAVRVVALDLCNKYGDNAVTVTVRPTATHRREGRAAIVGLFGA